MAFDIQGRLVLTGPFPSASQMAQDIQRQLNNISVNVQLNLPQNSVAQITQANQAINSVNAAAQQLNTQVNTAGSSVGQLGTKISNISRTSITSLKELEGSVRDTANAFTTFSDQVGYVTKRFAAYAVAATAIVSVSQAIKSGISDAISFQNELVKLSQIGENSASNIRAIASSVTELSQKYGVASKDLIASAVTLRQAGLDARQTAIALETLAQAATSPNFDNMARNTEGAIAVMNQFRLTATDLQRSFSSINAVAADFPVAARDIQEAIIRTGGVFSQLGGNLNEFIALFTSVKSVTQESSESIASGLRNIFTRLQSESTLDTLREFRINLRYTAEEARSLGNINFTNQFVGAAEAVKRIQTGLRDLSPTDPRFARIIESIGGTRQIGRALPLISQQGADVQQRALNIAEGGGASLTQSAERGLASLSRQATQTSEKFQELFRVITNSEGFTGLAGGLLAFGTRLAEVLKLLTPAIPLFTTLAAIKFGEGLFNFAATRGAAPLPNAGRFAQGGYASGGLSYLMPGEAVIPPINAAKLGYGSLRKLNEGGGFLSANNGFIVPGVGNQDSELHDLAPGSFVIRKSSVNKIRGYADGGIPDDAEATWKKNVGRISKNQKNVIPLDAIPQGFPIGQMTGNLKRIEYPDFSQMPTKLQRSGFDNGGIARYGFGDVVKNLIGNVTGLFRKKENIPTAMFTPPTTVDSPSNVPQVVEQALAQAKTVAPRFGVESDKSTAFKPSFIEEKNSNAESYALAIQNLNSLLNAVGVESFQSDLFNSPTLRQIGVSNPDNLDALLYKIRIRIEQASNFSSKAGFNSATSTLIQKKAELDALKTAVAGFQENLSIPVVDVTRVNNSSEEVIKHALELLAQGKAGSEVKENLSSTFGIANSTAAKYLSKAKKAGGYASGGRIESDSFYKSYFASAYQALGQRSGIDFNQIVGLDKINVSSLLKKTSFGAPAAGTFSPRTGNISLFPGNYAGVSDSETDDKGFLLRTLIHELGHAVDFNLGNQILGKPTYLSGDKNVFRGAKSPNLNYSDILLRRLSTKTNFTGYKKENADYYNGPNELFAELFVEALGAKNPRNRLKQDSELERGIDELKQLYFPLLPKFAGGGLSPLDKVPALLTPGEFVVNPETTARLGVANLDRANKGGSIDHIKGFNRGGFVGSYATGGPLQAIDELFGVMAKKWEQLIKDDKGSTGARLANIGTAAIGGVADSFKSANIEQRGFFTTSKSGEVGYDYQKLLKHYKDLESVVQKQVEYENKNLSAAEKRQLTEDRLNQIKIKASQYSALGSQFQANRGEIKSLLDIQALFATGKSGAQPLTVQETDRLAKLQNENQEIQARLRDAQRSLTFGFGKDEKGKDVIQEVDGRGSSANFFQGLFGKGTNVEARNARLQAASTSLILASSYAGDLLGRSAGNPEDVARNGVGGASYQAGRALSQASIYGGIGFSLGNAVAPGVGGVIGATAGAAYGGAAGTFESSRELAIAKFSFEVEKSTNALNTFVGSIDRINKSFTNSEVSQIQSETRDITRSANSRYSERNSGDFLGKLFGSNILAPLSLAINAYGASNEVSQGQTFGQGFTRSAVRNSFFLNSINPNFLENTESNQQRNIRLQALNTENPQIANSLRRAIEGFDANQLVNNRELTREQRNQAIRQQFSNQDLSLVATANGVLGNNGSVENQIQRYFQSSQFQNQQTAVERNLILSGGTSATAYLELGFKRFADNLSHAAESLESFGRNAEGVVQLLSGGTQFSRYSAPTALLNSPIGTSQYFNAVSSATAGLGGPGQTLARLGNVTGRLGEIGPEVLGNYLSQGANGPTLERRLLDRLQIDEGTQESAVVRNIAQSVSSIGEGDRNRFATPFAREQLFQQELAKYNQSLVSIAQQQERIVNAEVVARQQILNLTLKRQEFLGRAVDLDAQSLQFSAQQRAIRTFGSADAAINQISERQANAGFYSRINEAGRGVGPRGSSITDATSLTDIFSLAQNALQNRNRLLSDNSSPVGTNRRAINEFENQLISATRILEIYANGTSRLAVLQEKLNLVTQDRSSRIEGQRRFITGSEEDRAQTLQDRYIFEYIRNAGDAQQRTSAFNQLGQPGQAAYLRYSDQFRNVRFDANSTIGQEADRQLNATLPGNITDSLNSEQDRLASQITAILESSSTANNLLAALNNSTAAQLQTEATNFNTEALRTLSEQLERLKSFGEQQTAENVGGIAGRALSQVAGTPAFGNIQNTLGQLGYNLNNLGNASNRRNISGLVEGNIGTGLLENSGIRDTRELLSNISARESRLSTVRELNILRRRAFTPTTPALNEDSTDEEIARARLLYQQGGGMVYANQGFFQPRGTDTVPAMLTPGEMVVNATSTAANRGLLETINNAKGPVLYRSEGGAAEYFRRSGLTDFFNMFRRNQRVTETSSRSASPNYQDPAYQARLNEYLNTPSPYGGSSEPEIAATPEISGPKISEAARAIANAVNAPKISEVARAAANAAANQTAADNPAEIARFNAAADSSPFSPLGFQGDINRFGGRAAAYNFQQRATDNLLRQQLLSQTQTTGLYGTNLSGQLALAQRQQQAQTFANITQQNRRFLTYQTPQNPNQQLLQYLRGARRFATGGMVEGEDNVPAFLSEGEFVMNRSATRNIGANNLYNLQRFANGGLVGNGTNAGGSVGQAQNVSVGNNDSSELIGVLTSFSQNNQELVDALKGFPHTIELNATHKVEVIINGAAAFETMQETFRDMAIGLVDDKLQEFVKDNFPSLQ